jgi:hypothetical protein
MPTDSPIVLSGQPTPMVRTPSVRDPDLIDSAETQANMMGWTKFIDRTLVEWGRNPAGVVDDDQVPPTHEAIELSCQIAMKLRDAGAPPPTRIVPDGDGGICFERVEGRKSCSLRVYPDRTAELLAFDDCRLLTRVPLT